jgi:hypothetical protein
MRRIPIRAASAKTSASPIFADGRIYFLNEEGESVVIEPGKAFKKLASNQLDGQTLASMAVSGRSIYIRSVSHLYRLQQQSNPTSSKSATQ